MPPVPLKIDVAKHLAMLEEVLRSGLDRRLSADAIAILQRWQHDEHLNAASREKARALLVEFDT